ncbi:hypothetical protein D0T53_06525 [Dysgonomonas sp. 216]|uniref:hypothetical protein n=1 Tax=Dysgonomonas sp. 216 TaxID=2302934 RepID=UPI0013D65406|nr:hypothetical protein [Dysgonomonas sp. 216]NDW18569.1 hypothetical protein [Dysgonomonas sp. 216]
MKSLFFIFLCLISLFPATAQNIELLYKAEAIEQTIQTDQFEYIDFKMDLSTYPKIGTYKLIIDKQGKNSLSTMFYKLWDAANDIGANSFAIEDVTFSNNQYILQVDVYCLSEDDIQQNFSLYEDNIIVVFGDLNTKNTEKAKTFKMNKEKMSLYPYTYTIHQNQIGGKTKISIGGLLGSSIEIYGEEYKLGRCFSLGGTSVRPSGSVAVGNHGGGMGIGISIQTGSIYPMDLNLGLFVMTILDTVKNQAEESGELTED